MFLNYFNYSDAASFWLVFNFFCVFSIISGEKVCAQKSIIMYSTTSTTVNLTHTPLLLVSYYLETQRQKDAKCIKDKEAQAENKRWYGKERRSWGKARGSRHKHTQNVVLRLSLPNCCAFNTIPEFSGFQQVKNNLFDFLMGISDQNKQ